MFNLEASDNQDIPNAQDTMNGIAIIGMVGRFPGAGNIDQLWENLCQGLESTTFFQDQELDPSIDPQLINDPSYVKARGIIAGGETFDAAFFGINPLEASVMDPQARIFLELVHEALENAGYQPDSFDGLIGLYAGSGTNTYFANHICGRPEIIQRLGEFQTVLANEKDFLTTRAAYKLNLTGPSLNINTACSTSLVAVIQAYQALIDYQCDLALAGGVSMTTPQNSGYLTQEGTILSGDGHCRPFDAQSQGTMFNNGAGIVVLKRLEDALKDGDRIYAVIRGVGINNDGAGKASFTAPSVDGQAQAIAMAQAYANFHPESISYIEAHGTGTSLGDPIEIAGLTQAFRLYTDAKQFCAIGCIKSNIGHVVAAAGVAGLIKTALALHYQKIPPSLNFQTPNPQINFADSPFYVNTQLAEWKKTKIPRRAGVSSFGVGGTNAHIVIEEAPQIDYYSTPSRPQQLILLSAKTSSALEAMSINLREYLQLSDTSLADVAYTLTLGRKAYNHRRCLVGSDVNEVISALTSLGVNQVFTRTTEFRDPSVVFMFSGQGSQYVDMGRNLYDRESLFRDVVDKCAEILQPLLNRDLRELLYPTSGDRQIASEELQQTCFTQPALFTIEYALAQLWQSWGVKPEAMIGHSIGEFVAACIAGVFTLEDALMLVAKRGKLMWNLPRGAMLSVRLPVEKLAPQLSAQLAIAAVNGPAICVVSGSIEAIAAFHKQLEAQEIICRYLHTSHAFHSPMMVPIITDFAQIVAQVKLSPPKIPFVSTVTGDWITDREAIDPMYWANQLRQTVKFAPGIQTLWRIPERVLLEVGPRSTLTTLARQQARDIKQQLAIASLGETAENNSEWKTLLQALGQMWLTGVTIDWKKFYQSEKRQRIPLPTYPFERQRFWIDPPPHPAHTENTLENTMSSQPSAIHYTAIAPRKQRLIPQLLEVIAETSGWEISPEQETMTFLELGLDSLSLTQMGLALKKKFQVKVTLRQLMEGCSNLERLADFIDQALPLEAFSAPQPIPETVPVSSMSSANSNPTSSNSSIPVDTTSITPSIPTLSSLDVSNQVLTNGLNPQMSSPPIASTYIETVINQQSQIMAQQMQIMSQQLLLLGNQHNSSATIIHSQGNGHSSNGVNSPNPIAQKLPEKLPEKLPTPTTNPESNVSKKAFGAAARIETTQTKILSDQQRSHLEQIIQRYTKKTQKSKEFAQTHRSYLADPRTVSGFNPIMKEMVYPIVVARSLGTRLWDIDGNEYVDLNSGFGLNLFGWSPPFVMEAIAAQLQLGIEIGPQSHAVGEVAKLVCELTHLDRAAFCNTGSEAVMGAMRLARTVTGRNLIAIFSGAYHGIMDEVIVRGTQKLRSIPAAPGIPAEKVENVLVLEYDAPESLKILQSRADELAAVMVEPVQSRRPELQPREFLHQLRSFTELADIPLIFDEVITGFRIDLGGAQAYFGVKADIATYGKIVGGGLPIGVIAGTSKYMDALDGGFWQFGDDSIPEVGVTYFAGTFVRHPLVLAAAKAVLLYLKQSGPSLQQKLNQRTDKFVAELTSYFQQAQAPITADNFGSLFMLKYSPELPYGELFFYLLREKGVHAWDYRACFLTTAHTDADLDFIMTACKETVIEMQSAGFLGTSAHASGVKAKQHQLSTIPITESQQEIWAAVQMGQQASSAYIETQFLRLKGDVNLESLTDAIQKVVQRHESLRMTFSQDGNTIHIAHVGTVEVPIIDLADLESKEQETHIAQLSHSEIERPFDLEHGPLFRAKIIKLQPQEHLVLLLSHHIICDGWSWGVIVSDLSQFYSALQKGTVPDLEAPGLYSEYALAQVESAHSPEAIATEKYWLEQFSTSIPVLDFPTDRLRPPIRTFDASREDRCLPPELVSQLKQLGTKQGCSFMITILAGFEVWLHRLTGQEDIVVGVTSAGQAALDQYNLVGHCVNLLPMRSHIDGEKSFLDYLRDRRTSILDAYDHQIFTFGSLIRKLTFPREAGRIPLVPIVFNIDQTWDESNVSFVGLEVDCFSQPRAFENFELFINVTEVRGRMTLECQYNTNLFNAETIHRRLAELETILLGIVSNPDQMIAKLPIQSAFEQNLLAQWNNTQADYPLNKCIHHLFEEQVERSPNAIAASFQNSQLTYQQLNQRANQLANYLQNKGVGPEVLVGICVERSLEMLIGLLGILKAGGAYVPLDPSYPTERLLYMLSDTSMSVLLTQDSLLASLPVASISQVVCLDTDWIAISEHNQENCLSQVKSDNLAYIIYTSGSTGKPKGVQINHNSVVNLLISLNTYPGFTASDVFNSVTTICFDVSVVDLYLTLMIGAKLIIVPQEISVDGNWLLSQLQKSGATVMLATPATCQILLAFSSSNQDLLGIKLICAGEALPTQLASQLQARGAQLWNFYGPTEATVYATGYRVGENPRDRADETVTISIGRPIANTQVYILDRYLQPVPIGVTGELHIGGAGLSRGYLHRSELTAEKFITYPCETSQRIYKTGDLARYLPNGNIEYVGRIDNQVKIRGFRIELGEIETVLRQHSAIAQAVVIADEKTPGEKRLVAYIVSHQQQPPTTQELQQFLSQKLTNYMIPAFFVFLEKLPLTPNGKVDFQALSALDFVNKGNGANHLEPRNQLERELVQIWQNILGIQSIGIKDNFFELGGHSISAVRLLSKLQNTFSYNLPLATFFTAQTIEQLANIITPTTPTTPTQTAISWSSLVPIQANGKKPALFCIHAIWGNVLFYRKLSRYLEPDQPVYGLQSQGLDGNVTPSISVNEMATHYIQEIRTIQPEGPYYILGFSFGGIVAFEIARQLHSQNQETALLGILDTSAPITPAEALFIGTGNQRIKRLLNRPLFHLYNISKLELMEKIIYILERIQWHLMVGKVSLLYRYYLRYIKRSLQELRLMDLNLANTLASKSYIPLAFPGKLTLFRCIDKKSSLEENDLSWSKLIGSVEIEAVPGHHTTMMEEPNVRYLAEKVTLCLAKVQQK